jgi:hypothetical protein
VAALAATAALAMAATTALSTAASRVRFTISARCMSIVQMGTKYTIPRIYRGFPAGQEEKQKKYDFSAVFQDKTSFLKAYDRFRLYRDRMK